MAQWGFYFDQSRCVGCKACNLACKNWNELRRGDSGINQLIISKYEVPVDSNEKGSVYIDQASGTTNYAAYRPFYMKENWRRVSNTDKGAVVLNADNSFTSTFDRRYLSLSCNHCDDPACVKVCPQGVIYKEKSIGAVLTNFEACISCGRCHEACPWGATQFYDDNYASYMIADPKRPKMTKCTFCVDRVTQGLKPACVAACWNRALDAGPVEELKERYKGQYVDKLDEFADSAVPSLDISSTKPNIIFKRK